MIEPPKKATQESGDKRFNAYPKTTPLFLPGAGPFSTQMQDSIILKKPEIPKSIRVTESQTLLPETTFQQQGPSVPKRAEKPESEAKLSQQINGEPKSNNSEPRYPTSNLPTEW